VTHNRFFVGVDWAEQHHDIAVVDRTGTVIARERVANSPAGVKALLCLLSGLRSSHTHSRRHVPVAIETRNILLVTALRQAGQPVYPINPVIVTRHRGRISPARKKSDPADAELLAQILRIDPALHRPHPR